MAALGQVMNTTGTQGRLIFAFYRHYSRGGVNAELVTHLPKVRGVRLTGLAPKRKTVTHSGANLRIEGSTCRCLNKD